jgi:hypothetical protein
MRSSSFQINIFLRVKTHRGIKIFFPLGKSTAMPFSFYSTKRQITVFVFAFCPRIGKTSPLHDLFYASHHLTFSNYITVFFHSVDSNGITKQVSGEHKHYFHLWGLQKSLVASPLVIFFVAPLHS